VFQTSYLIGKWFDTIPNGDAYQKIMFINKSKSKICLSKNMWAERETILYYLGKLNFYPKCTTFNVSCITFNIKVRSKLIIYPSIIIFWFTLKSIARACNYQYTWYIDAWSVWLFSINISIHVPLSLTNILSVHLSCQISCQYTCISKNNFNFKI